MLYSLSGVCVCVCLCGCVCLSVSVCVLLCREPGHLIRVLIDITKGTDTIHYTIYFDDHRELIPMILLLGYIIIYQGAKTWTPTVCLSLTMCYFMLRVCYGELIKCYGSWLTWGSGGSFWFDCLWWRIILTRHKGKLMEEEALNKTKKEDES